MILVSNNFFEEMQRVENYNNQIYYMSPFANPLHSKVVANIHFAIRMFLKNSLCEVFGDSLDVYLDQDHKTYVIPDVSIICDRSNIKKDGYHGIPKFIVEVLSPSTRERDMNEKKELYESYGIPEYWIVDPFIRAVDVYHLINKKYQRVRSYAELSEKEIEQSLKHITLEEYKKPIILKEFPNIVIEVDEIFEGLW